ncbi:MAG: hypothetical protein F4094_06660 [Synechococcus sp. SB0672_bin_6]|nr:hypothetical protein [Synechococcus sp. SB0675_bin_6]MYJ60142.1 hypothetical protein [Synechococcus sp. SB0672_bin_6]
MNPYFKFFEPPKTPNLLKWSQDNICLREGEKFRPYEYQKEILECLTPGFKTASGAKIHTVVLLKSARVGRNAIIGCATSYFCQGKYQGNQLLIESNADLAKNLIREDLQHVWRNSTISHVLKDTVDNTGKASLLHKTYGSNYLTVVSATDANALRMKTIHRLFMDEVSGFPISSKSEGDPIELAKVRQLTIPDRICYLGSTPLFTETCRITQAFQEGDQRGFRVLCPSCNKKTTIEFEHLVYINDDPETTKWQCPICNDLIPYSEQAKMVASGKWYATKKGVPGIASFRIWSGYTPHHSTTWPRIIEQHLISEKSQDQEKIRVFQKEWLGRPYQLPKENEEKDGQALIPFLDQSYKFNTLPSKVKFLTIGVDVQSDELHFAVYGFSDDYHHFSETGNGDLRMHRLLLLERQV